MTAGVERPRAERRFSETAITILEALLIALVVRSFLIQPFNIPSGSMEPTLLVGDYLFVSKFSYGFSRYSLPFSPPLFSGRILAGEPNRGDVVVFRHGEDDFIKRVIGLPGDRIQVVHGTVVINGTPVERHRIADFVGHDPCRPTSPNAPRVRVLRWQETLPNGVSYDTLQCSAGGGFPDDTGVYSVPAGHFFMMGDNRENSEDSRFPDVGYVPLEKLIGRAQLIFFSIGDGASAWQVWHWPASVRWSRLFTLVR
ncbi:MAG TPA: signal peptidase I [Xanthobacteraceae bacterium]|jgi:signal peptidase I